LNQIIRHDIRNELQLVETYAELLDYHADDETPRLSA
jgi:light-regulated signal transduction histidine kinase (bacteriophytochrome)